MKAWHILLIIIHILSKCKGFVPAHKQHSQSFRMASSPRTEFLDKDLVDALDLHILVEKIVPFAATKRAVDAFRQVVRPKQPRGRMLGRQRQQARVPVAYSASEATHLYTLVEQAVLCLEKDTADSLGLEPPPIYGLQSSPLSLESLASTDDDEWLDFSSFDEWELIHVAQATEVVKKALNVLEWSRRDTTQLWMPSLSSMVTPIDGENLSLLFKELKGAVSIVKSRTAQDPMGNRSYLLELSSNKFPSLAAHRRRQQNNDQSIDTEELESDILKGLVASIQKHTEVIDSALTCVAELDVIFAKAAFGLAFHGQIPRVTSGEGIQACDFFNPTLSANKGRDERVTPIDLMLPSGEGLVISGPNGGGKSVAMKSFGIAAVLCRLGIPIPIRSQRKQPSMDFFDQILVSFGDNQCIEDGLSTYLGQLTSLSKCIHRVESASDLRSLVLIDELGGGTEALAGEAIGQAILEQFLRNPLCNVVTTTHASRLKQIALEDNSMLSSAAVLLSDEQPNECGRSPSFRLEYGIAGKSHALEAIRRCQPGLPLEVIHRSTQLVSETQKQDVSDTATWHVSDQILQKKAAVNDELDNAVSIRLAMQQLASGYEQKLALLESRLDDCLKSLRDGTNDDVQLVGELVGELRVSKKRVASERQLLQQKGLRRVTMDDVLSPGDSVVFIDPDLDCDLSGVVISSTRNNAQVTVQTSPFCSGDDVELADSDVIECSYAQLAVWDFDDAFRENSEKDRTKNSRNRLQTVLASIGSSSATSWTSHSGTNGDKDAPNYRSARSRKSAKRKKR